MDLDLDQFIEQKDPKTKSKKLYLYESINRKNSWYANNTYKAPKIIIITI